MLLERHVTLCSSASENSRESESDWKPTVETSTENRHSRVADRSFIWVVRDFALDLVDEYGTEITSDEYLERALSTQVSF